MLDFENIKIGDEVIVKRAYSIGDIYPISRILPTQFCIKWHTGAESSFRKRDGRGVGMWSDMTAMKHVYAAAL